MKHLHTLGQAKNLTFINYAFGNVYKQADGTYKCDASITRTESGNGDGGDQWASYGKGFDAASSVDGVGDPYGFAWDDPRTGKAGPLKGNFGQLAKLKKLYPNIKVLISLGGWSWSKYFSAAAATDAGRKALVSSCIDTYIKGNLPFDSGSNAGGPGSAAGVFDGIDIDWEYPGVQGIGYNIVDPVNDGANQVLLFKEFRAQLDALSKTNGKKYYLTSAIGAGLKNIKATKPAEYFAPQDWVNLMSYDYNGAWAAQGPTDFQSNLYPDPASPNFATNPDFNTDTSVKNLVAAGAPIGKLNIGVPFYGRGWTGVKAGPAGDGLYQSATGAARGTYENGFEDYKVLKNAPGTVYNHPVTKQAYKYDGNNWWSYDTVDNIKTKAAYAKSKGMAGIFAWEADGDLGSELTDAMGSINK